MPATAPAKSATALSKPNPVDAYIASEMARIQRTKDNPATNPENIPHIILDRINKYAGELHTRRRNNDTVNPAFMTENMSLTEVAFVISALSRALADHLDECVKQPDWEQRGQYGDWRQSVAHFARVNNG